jgi:hypothetical protein
MLKWQFQIKKTAYFCRHIIKNEYVSGEIPNHLKYTVEQRHKNLKEIQTDYKVEGLTCDKIISSFKALKQTSAFSVFNRVKSKGYLD